MQCASLTSSIAVPSAGRCPEANGFVPALVARGVVGPADGWSGEVVDDGDDGRGPCAVVVLVGVHADGSRGECEAHVAGVGGRVTARSVMVGEHGRQRRQERGGRTVENGFEQFSYSFDLRGWFVEVAVLEHVHAWFEVLDDDVIGGGHVDEEGVVAVGDQEPGRVVCARVDGATEGLDGGRRRGMASESEGKLTSGALGCVGAVASGRLVSPAMTPASLVASHVPPPTSSRPPRIAGPPPSVSRQVIGIAGRSRRSSRLAATISGSPGTIPLITINRHIATQRTSRLVRRFLSESS